LIIINYSSFQEDSFAIIAAIEFIRAIKISFYTTISFSLIK